MSVVNIKLVLFDLAEPEDWKRGNRLAQSKVTKPVLQPFSFSSEYNQCKTTKSVLHGRLCTNYLFPLVLDLSPIG